MLGDHLYKYLRIGYQIWIECKILRKWIDVLDTVLLSLCQMETMDSSRMYGLENGLITLDLPSFGRCCHVLRTCTKYKALCFVVLSINMSLSFCQNPTKC